LYEADQRINEVVRINFKSSIQDYSISYKNKDIKSAALFGGIDYDMTDFNAMDTILESGYNSIKFPEKLSKSLRGYIGKWKSLKETNVEIHEINKLLQNNGYLVDIFNRSKGNEYNFKKITLKERPPQILHFATHGFFFPKMEKEEIVNSSDPIFKISEHPMLRSGLILAGANYAWTHGHPKDPDGEDGILTAYEISQMDLSGTELVVLSACETGLGDIKGNEGVYGLQRAFKIAGAKYIIMSLWKVPDFQTRKLMTTFYDYWLNKEMEIPEAFRAAQQKMKEVYEDPYYWAGFILVQ
jgi:CHAT domain-containing protein